MWKKILLYLLILLSVLLFSFPLSVEKKEDPFIIVEVRGAVIEEKNIEVARGTTFQDLLEKIQLEEDADISSFSFNHILYDEEVIVIPRKKTEAELKVSLNSAGIDELILLPGIGEKTALLILEYREIHGCFHSIEELMEVKGIGEKKYEKIREYLIL